MISYNKSSNLQSDRNLLLEIYIDRHLCSKLKMLFYELDINSLTYSVTKILFLFLKYKDLLLWINDYFQILELASKTAGKIYEMSLMLSILKYISQPEHSLENTGENAPEEPLAPN